ncbi:MAG: flagellar biosynthetic protein FliQ [Acidimicrobiales bacterium]
MDAELMRLISDTLLTATRLSAPILISALVVGVVIGLGQTVFQVQEATLTFVPKLVVIAIVLAVSGNWMLDELQEFFLRSLDSVPALIAG